MIDIPDCLLPKNEKGEIICPKCKGLAAACVCHVVEPPSPKKTRFTPHTRIEKSGRKGKTVTIISALPGDENYLQELTKRLKMKTGSGGTHYITENDGTIEIQGDHRKVIDAYFTKEGAL
jgi:translation initiation factor 1